VLGPGSTQVPVALSRGGVALDPAGSTPAAFAHFSGGEPFAFSNPIYLDRDANGRFDPPFPLAGR
jgi:hypothetical protein